MQEPEPSTRDKILIAAATMLTEDPTTRLSVRAVATRADVSTGSLRHFFPTQRELIDTVVAGLSSLDIPDDPMDATMSPSERLEACLHLLLAEVGSGEASRQYVDALHRTYIATRPDDDSTHAFAALERLAVQRVERWLAVLAKEGALATTNLQEQARFLFTVVNGLALERALPGAQKRLAYETSTLKIAISSLLDPTADANSR